MARTSLTCGLPDLHFSFRDIEIALSLFHAALVLASSRTPCRETPTSRFERQGSSSSPGVFQRRPSIEKRSARPLPSGHPLFGPRLPPSCSFRPCRSSRLRRLPPRASSQVCCTLHPILGFGAFQAPPLANISRCRARSLPSPAPRFTPFRAFPSPTAVPRHRGPCPLTVRARPEGHAPISGPCSADESVVSGGVAANLDPMLSWASFPSRVLPEFSARSVSRRSGVHIAGPPLDFRDARAPRSCEDPPEGSGGVVPASRGRAADPPGVPDVKDRLEVALEASLFGSATERLGAART